MSVINVQDANGSIVAVQAPLAPGRADASSSRPVALSNEDSTALSNISAQENPVQGAVVIATSDTVTFTAQRKIAVVCTVAGNVKFGFADATTITISVSVGTIILPWAANQVFVTGTTATATYYALK